MALISSPFEASTSSIFDSENGSGELSSTVIWRVAPEKGKLQGDGGRKKLSVMQIEFYK